MNFEIPTLVSVVGNEVLDRELIKYCSVSNIVSAEIIDRELIKYCSIYRNAGSIIRRLSIYINRIIDYLKTINIYFYTFPIIFVVLHCFLSTISHTLGDESSTLYILVAALALRREWNSLVHTCNNLTHALIKREVNHAEP